jgi:hypothetical protein
MLSDAKIKQVLKEAFGDLLTHSSIDYQINFDGYIIRVFNLSDEQLAKVEFMISGLEELQSGGAEEVLRMRAEAAADMMRNKLAEISNM